MKTLKIGGIILFLILLGGTGGYFINVVCVLWVLMEFSRLNACRSTLCNFFQKHTFFKNISPSKFFYGT